MQIQGNYFTDDNFTTVFVGETIYTIPHNAPSEWGCISIGESLPYGGKLTHEQFAEGLERADRVGTFTLS